MRPPQASLLNFQFSSNMAIEATLDPESPVMETFFRHYDAAFVLPDEKEGRDGFIRCLRLNQSPDYEKLSARCGPFREFVLVARDIRSGGVVGGANFIVFPLPVAAPVLSINLNYIFVAPEWRRQGYFRTLLRAVQHCAAESFNDQAMLPQLVFIEQNDPIQMGDANYRRDTLHSGLDQMDRLLIWAKLGALVLDFPYVQPALSKDQSPDETLSFAVLGSQSGTLSACVLHEHLLRFFGISVLKGEDPALDPAASKQLSTLLTACKEGLSIPLISLAALTREALSAYGAKSAGKPSSLRDALRNPGANW
jgi:hypothetical protein